MFIIKRLLQLQAGRISFRCNESLNLLGGIEKKKDPLIPYDKDMLGVVTISSASVSGELKYLSFFKGHLTDEYITISPASVSGTLAPAS